MISRWVGWLALVVLLFGGCAIQRPNRGDESAQAQIRALAEFLKADGVGVIETYHIPLASETPGDVTPDALLRGWYYKTTIRHLSASSRVALATAFMTASVSREQRMADLRQGIVFYSSRDHVALSAIYFDQTGRHGVVNGVPLSFERGFLARLKAALPLALE